jgi:molecular chaperone HscB
MCTDAFDLLGLEPAYTVDAAALRRAFLRRAAGMHPDHHGEEESSEEATAALTAAREVLADPLSRAEVLLARLGGPGKETEKSLPEGFLMYIMGVREEVEADLEADPEGARAWWTAWALARREENERLVAGLFEKHAQGGGVAALPEVRRALNAWRYIERLIEQLSARHDPAHADRPGPGGRGT